MIGTAGNGDRQRGNMLGRDKLLRDGEEGKGVIVDARPGDLVNLHGERSWHLRVRVTFEDGETTEADCEIFDLGLAATGPPSGLEPYPLAAGTVIPLRYDRKNRSQIAVDRPKMIADTKASYEANRQKKVAAAEASIAPRSTSAPQARENDENYLVDAIAEAQARGNVTEVQRLAQRLDAVIRGAGTG